MDNGNGTREAGKFNAGGAYRSRKIICRRYIGYTCKNYEGLCLYSSVSYRVYSG